MRDIWQTRYSRRWSGEATLAADLSEEVQNGRVQVELPVDASIDELEDGPAEREPDHQVPSPDAHEFQVFELTLDVDIAFGVDLPQQHLEQLCLPF